MDQELIDLYLRHIAMAYDRQIHLSNYLDSQNCSGNWNYNVPTARLTLGHLDFTALVIGSHSDHDNSWLWAWDNPHINLSDENRGLSVTVRELGERHGCASLTATGGIDCSEVMGEELSSSAAHVFAAIVSRGLGFHAYYTIPYEGGRAAAVIRDERLLENDPYPLIRISNRFAGAIGALPIHDHRAALIGYVTDNQLKLELDSPGEVRAVYGRDSLTAKFDEYNRLAEINSSTGPRSG
jgi:hypothetical protein